MPFSRLGLSDQLVQGILATGYAAPTAIQSRAIPHAIAGRDIIGIAQTGTGKTAAFVLPMINHFTTKITPAPRHHVRGLVLTPTRELAQQVEDFISGYARFTNLRSLSVFGGTNINNQVRKLERGVDIVIATPGRLIDHLNRHTVTLSSVEILVLDEADRMFDMGFIDDVKKIISHVPTKRQTMLFSATFSKEVQKLVASVQHHPELIEIGKQRQPVETVSQHFYAIQRKSKTALLLHILKTGNPDSVLVFTRTKHEADSIAHVLKREGIRAATIHSNRTQAQRQRALSGFKYGEHTILIATNIAARGIDVEGISHVINYDTPNFPEDYIHRIGRTGRAEATGDAITFVSHEELDHLRKIERFIGKKISMIPYPGFDPTSASLVKAEHRQQGGVVNPHPKRASQPGNSADRKEPPRTPWKNLPADWRTLLEFQRQENAQRKHKKKKHRQ